jgi:heptosyltransferase-1
MAPRKILLIKLSSIGDVVLATPVIRVLREAYPDSHIAWLVEEKSADVVTDNPLLDEVIVWQKAQWKELLGTGRLITLWGKASSFIRGLRARRFDLALDLQGLLKSAVLAYLSGAKERVGLGSREGSHVFMTRVISWKGDMSIVGSQYMEFVQSLGLEPGRFRPEVYVGEEEEAFVADLRRDSGVTGGYAVICPFASKPQKNWLEERWGEVSGRLTAGYGMPVVILGGKGDMDSAGRMESLSRGGTVNLAGRTTVKQAAAVIKHSCLLIGVDTGLTHMGIAFDVPTIALFGSTCGYAEVREKNVVAIYKKMECSPCRRNPTCDGDLRCMKAITGEDVLGAVSGLLDRP